MMFVPEFLPLESLVLFRGPAPRRSTLLAAAHSWIQHRVPQPAHLLERLAAVRLEVVELSQLHEDRCLAVGLWGPGPSEWQVLAGVTHAVVVRVPGRFANLAFKASHNSPPSIVSSSGGG